MRYPTVFLLALLLWSCASDYIPDDPLSDPTYAMASNLTQAAPDTLPLPEASYNDSLKDHPPGTPAPTPYGLTIDEPGISNQTAKGGTTGTGPTNLSPAAPPQRMIAGRWMNADDADEQVQLTPTHYMTYYEGELLVEENMTWYDRCPDACSGGTSTGKPCFTVSGPAQTDCYGIVNLTPSRLELQLLGVSNETIVYRKVD